MKRKAKEIMATSVVTLRPQDSVQRAIGVLLDNNVSGAPVVDEKGKLVGFISEYDLGLAVHCVGAGLDVQKAMKRETVTVNEDTPLEEIVDLMLQFKIKRIPVVNQEQQPVGIVSQRDVLAVMAAEA